MPSSACSSEVCSRSEEHTSELQSHANLVCRLLLEKKMNTLQSAVNDDKKWFALLNDFFQHFKYQNLMTEDVGAYFNQFFFLEIGPPLNPYLCPTALPPL